MGLLHTVAITGADDAVPIVELLKLSRAFPFVEWGVLRSTDRSGTPRYPSDTWLDELGRSALLQEREVRFAAHLCGSRCREVLSGNPMPVDNESGLFRRFQLNGWSSYRLAGLRVARMNPDVGFIAQAINATEFQLALSFAEDHHLENLGVLLDPSGGRGVVNIANESVVDLLDRFTGDPRCGYAGGISPDNAREVMDRLDGRFGWIDMESGVRTDDRFDLAKVERVLRICEPYVGASLP